MANSLKLTNRRVLELHRGLNSLDAIRVGKDELVPFVFDSDTKWSLVQNAVAVENAKEAFDRFERQAAKTHGIYDGMPRTDANAAKLAVYVEEIEAAKDREVEISGLAFIKRASLLNQPLDSADKKAVARQNQIPTSVLRMLAPILTADE